MEGFYPSDAPDLALMRALCEHLGVTAGDADLEAVRGFLDRILPALDDISRRLPPAVVPAGP